MATDTWLHTDSTAIGGPGEWGSTALRLGNLAQGCLIILKKKTGKEFKTL